MKCDPTGTPVKPQKPILGFYGGRCMGISEKSWLVGGAA